MTWDSPTTYYLDLDQLTATTALFHHFGHDQQPSGVSVTLTRDVWHELGRPGRITASPWKADR